MKNLSPIRIATSLLAIWLIGPPVQAEDLQPDVLFIALDDLNDYISIFGGHPDAQTPNFDRLAKHSLTFTNAHTASPVCTSSRCALMTGREPFVTGVYQNRQPWIPVVKQFGSLNQEFMANGYHVAGTGKIYHTFTFIDGHWSETSKRFRWPKPRKKNRVGTIASFDGAMLPDQTEEKTGDYLSVSWASERLANPPADQPQFVACGIYRPHGPWHVPKKYFDQFDTKAIALPTHMKADSDLDDVPSYGKRLAYTITDDRPAADYESSPHAQILAADKWKLHLHTYLACIAYADAQLGRLLDAWEVSPRRENTIIVLWSDHGYHLGEKAHWRKATLWEQSTRVPLMIRAPGLTTDGASCDATASLIDIYPTLRDLCGLDGETKLDGDSLRALLTDPQSSKWRNHALTTYRDGSIAIRTSRYRLIRYADGSEELYDRSNDPEEFTNLIDDERHAETVSELRSRLPDTVAPSVGMNQGGKKRRGGSKK